MHVKAGRQKIVERARLLACQASIFGHRILDRIAATSLRSFSSLLALLRCFVYVSSCVQCARVSMGLRLLYLFSTNFIEETTVVFLRFRAICIAILGPLFQAICKRGDKYNRTSRRIRVLPRPGCPEKQGRHVSIYDAATAFFNCTFRSISFSLNSSSTSPLSNHLAPRSSKWSSQSATRVRCFDLSKLGKRAGEAEDEGVFT